LINPVEPACVGRIHGYGAEISRGGRDKCLSYPGCGLILL
jgi:hypothetical protein